MRRASAVTVVVVLLLWMGVVHVTAPTMRWPDSLPGKLEITFGSTTVDVMALKLVNKQQVRLTYGAPNESGNVVPGLISFELDNPDSDFTPYHPVSQYWPYVELGVTVVWSVYWLGQWWIRFTGQASEWKPDWPYGDLSDELKGVKGEARVTVVASGLLRQIAQGRSPQRSPLFRSIVGTSPGDFVPHDYWAMEEGPDASQIASAVGRAAVVPVGGITYSVDGPAGSAPLPSLDAGAKLAFPVAPYVDAGQWAVEIAIKVPVKPAVVSTLFEIPVASGSIAVWRVEVEPAGGFGVAEIWLRGYGPTGSLVRSEFGGPLNAAGGVTEAQFFGHPFMFTVASEQSGANLVMWLGFSDGRPGFSNINQFADPGTHQPLIGPVTVDVTTALDGLGIGHLGIFVDPLFDPFLDGLDHFRAFAGWTNEQAHNRIARLCHENGVAVTIIGTSSALMGPQQIDIFYNLLAAGAAVDLGILYEDREALALVYRCNKTLYNQSAALTLNARRNEITGPFRPTLDDLNVRNDVTIARLDGSEYRSVVENGRRSIQAAPNGVGTYDEKLSLNLFTDPQAAFNATWRTWRGTWQGMRYARISPHINAVPSVADTWLEVNLGDLIAVTDLPPQHPKPAVESILRGYSELYEPKKWEPIANASPAGPYRVGQAGDGSNAGAWTQTGPATALAAQMKPGDTSVTVTIDGALFSTAANLTLHPLELWIDGDIARVTAISGAGPTQTFTVQRTYPQLRRLAGALVRVNNPLIACL